MPPPTPINLQSKFALITEHWTPKVIAEMNDYQFKLVKLQGDFVWHQHDHTDETFLVVEGNLTIELRDPTLGDTAVHIGPGELYVVGKGIQHRPRAAAEVKLLLIEPRGVVNTGEATTGQTAPNDVWI
jgi:mannose-6-phosphate isomerase-like protein (cupin superfamily)